MIYSTGDIQESYESLGVIYADHSSEGAFDYMGALKLLTDLAEAEQADGVIHISFNERMAIGQKQVCFQNQDVQMPEVRVWGTMIKLKK